MGDFKPVAAFQFLEDDIDPLDGVNGPLAGNAFSESLESLWHKTDELLSEHINKNYCGKCGKCDEWYTFNF